MKKILSACFGLIVSCVLHGADPGSLAFGGERIGVPPLSLAESIAKSAATTKPPRFGTGLPNYSAVANQPNLSLKLIPHTWPNVAQREPGRPAPSARVSRAFGMPIFEPSDVVDYKLTMVPPDPRIDFKMVVKDPTPVSESARAK